MTADPWALTRANPPDGDAAPDPDDTVPCCTTGAPIHQWEGPACGVSPACRVTT